MFSNMRLWPQVTSADRHGACIVHQLLQIGHKAPRYHGPRAYVLAAAVVPIKAFAL